ncbi:MAG: CpXC domain-containing protein [Abditibacteriota bacterium]|nr:CpXC domain-containing protein [Abditibacteriota bacterium]
MSLNKKTELVCSRCRKVFPFIVWDCVDTLTSPFMKEAVLNGSAFTACCPSCGKKEYVDYDMCYFDPEKNLDLRLAVSSEALAEFSGCFDLKDENCIFRVVQSRRALQEKINIFERGLDDRIIEFIKHISSIPILVRHPACELEVYYSGEGRKHFLEFYKDGEEYCISKMSMRQYTECCRMFEMRVNSLFDDGPFIDSEWVDSLLVPAGMEF